MSKPLELWTVYSNPKEHPGRFVARKWLFGRITSERLDDTTLEGLRLKLPQGLIRLERTLKDGLDIVEIWL